MKTKPPEFTEWRCAVCNESDGLGGGIVQSNGTRAIAGYCRWCDQRRVLVKRHRKTQVAAVPMRIIDAMQKAYGSSRGAL